MTDKRDAQPIQLFSSPFQILFQRLLCRRVRFRMKERQQYTEKYTDVRMIRVRRVLRPMAFLRASLGLLFRRGPELLPGVCRIF